MAAAQTAFEPSQERNSPLDGLSWPIFVTWPLPSKVKAVVPPVSFKDPPSCRVISPPATTTSPLTVSTPTLERLIVSAAVSEAAVLKESFVGLALLEKVFSATASIPAHTKVPGEPEDSSGA